jgi:hypothetical protein
MIVNRRLKPSGYKMEGRCPELWDDIFGKIIAMDGLRLVAGRFTSRSADIKSFFRNQINSDNHWSYTPHNSEL